MTRITLFATCLLALALTTSTALAYDLWTSFGWTPRDNFSSGGVVVSLLPDGHTGYDAGEAYTLDADHCGESSEIKAFFRRDNGVDGWDGPSGWYWTQQLPTPGPGSSVTLKGLYVWAWPAFSYDDFNTGYNASPAQSLSEWAITFRLVGIPCGIGYTGPREWTCAMTTNRLLPNAVLPACKTDRPLTGYEFEIEIQHVVPEPSSILALISGFPVLGALALRRRRRQ